MVGGRRKRKRRRRVKAFPYIKFGFFFPPFLSHARSPPPPPFNISTVPSLLGISLHTHTAIYSFLSSTFFFFFSLLQLVVVVDIVLVVVVVFVILLLLLVVGAPPLPLLFLLSFPLVVAATSVNKSHFARAAPRVCQTLQSPHHEGQK